MWAHSKESTSCHGERIEARRFKGKRKKTGPSQGVQNQIKEERRHEVLPKLKAWECGRVVLRWGSTTVSTHQIWPPNFSYFCQIWPRLVKFQISNLTSSGKICLERSNLKFHFWPPNFKFDLLQKTGSRVHHTQKITINKIYHAWTQKSNLMLNLGQNFTW